MSAPQLRGESSGGRTVSTLPSEAEWTRIRPTFESLYIEEHLALADVMAVLHLKHNFKATKQMFKRRIRQWGLGKNLKQQEVEHILGILADRTAHGKRTVFLLQGRMVDMRNVRTYQRRHKLRTGDAIAKYVTGQSMPCRDLRALTPEHLDASSWKAPDQSYEDTLRAFGALFGGLVDSQYYWIEVGEIVMPPSILRGEVSDVCSSLVASKIAGQLNMTMVRKLALLLESIVRSGDAWIHCRLVYTLWIITTAGHPTVTQTLLAHLNALAKAKLHWSCSQYRFVSCYSSLETSRASRFAADIISLKASMVKELRIEADSVAFKLRSLDYDVFWREREQGNAGQPARALSLFERCHDILGPLAVETLTVLRSMFQDNTIEYGNDGSLDNTIHWLKDSSKLEFCESPPAFTFDKEPLGMEAASELACIYCELDSHDAEAWIMSKLLIHQKQTASALRREYSLLIHLSRCRVLSRREGGLAWLQRKQEIDSIWQREVEAIVLLKDGCKSQQKNETLQPRLTTV